MPTPTPVPTAATLADDRGDYLDENGEPVKDGPPSTDILSVQAAAGASNIDLAMDIAEAPPNVDPVSHQQLYGWSIDTTGDGVPDWQVLVQNVDSDDSEQNAVGWVAALFSYETAYSQEGREFPGTMDFEGTHVHVGLPLDAVGSPRSAFRLVAYTEDIEFPDMDNDPLKTIQRDDKAPDRQWPDDGAEWITIGVP